MLRARRAKEPINGRSAVESLKAGLYQKLKESNMITTPEQEEWWETLFREQLEETELRDSGDVQCLKEPFAYPVWSWESIEHLRPKSEADLPGNIPEHIARLFQPRERRVPYTGTKVKGDVKVNDPSCDIARLTVRTSLLPTAK